MSIKLQVCILLVVVVIFSSCSGKYTGPHFSIPQNIGLDDEKNIGRIIIASTGNPNSDLSPQIESVESTTGRKKISYNVGGAGVLGSYIKILRKNFPKQSVLLDSGNILEEKTNKKKRRRIFKFYKHLRYDAIAMGPGELLNINPKAKYLKKYKNDFLISNIIDLNTGKNYGPKHILPYKIVEKSGVKIGIISITAKKLITSIKNKRLKKLYVEEPVLSFLKARSKLLKKGASLIILMTNISTNCRSSENWKSKNIMKLSENKITCDKSDELLQFIKRLPPRSVNLVINNGHGSEIITGFLMKIPVIQNPMDGKHILLSSFFYDKKSRKVEKFMVTLHPPVKLCHHFFADRSDCHLNKNEKKLSTLYSDYNSRETGIKNISDITFKPASFLGNIVKRDDQLIRILDPQRTLSK